MHIDFSKYIDKYKLLNERDVKILNLFFNQEEIQDKLQSAEEGRKALNMIIIISVSLLIII
jgi:succinate dehydrogenase flavin-adding protein (antitoxin of CptAB toxin-antitoxin module)